MAVDLRDRTTVRVRSREVVSTTPVTIDPLTSAITVAFRRPTTADPLDWSAASRLRVTIVCRVDGVEHRGWMEWGGGIRRRRVDTPDEAEVGAEVMRYWPTATVPRNPPLLRADGQPWRTVEQDGAATFARARHVGTNAATIEAWIEVEHRGGPGITIELLAAVTEEHEGRLYPYHESISFDAASALEGSGSSSWSWDHTVAASSNMALTVCVGSSAGSPSLTSDVTYDSVSLDEQVDVTPEEFVHGSQHTTLSPSTGTNTVAVTLAAGDDESGGIAVSHAGVGAVGATGSNSGDSTTATSPSLTTADSTDLVVGMGYGAGGTTITAAGSPQVSRQELENLSGFTAMDVSEKPGTGSPVSLAWTVGSFEWVTTGVVYEEAGAAPLPLGWDEHAPDMHGHRRVTIIGH